MKLLLFLIVSWCKVITVSGWGKYGHEIVGNVASSLLSKKALRNIAHLLNISATNHTTTIHSTTIWGQYNNNNINDDCYEYCSPLAIIANWADHVRIYYHWSAPYHYIDVRDDLVVPNGCHVTSPFVLLSKQQEDECSFHYARDCPDDICVAGAIMNYTQRLQDGFNQFNIQESATILTSSSLTFLDAIHYTMLQESLMFLVHFIGDIHQPLHCSRTTDRGGNTIHVHYQDRYDTDVISKTSMASHEREFDHLNVQRYLRPSSNLINHHRSLNLHAVWDDSIIETILQLDFHKSRQEFELSLISYIWDMKTNHPDIYNNQWLRCNNATNIFCVSQWGQESFHYAMQYAYSNVDGTEITDGSILTKEYYVSRNPIVRIQLAKAAVRLASVLEQIFGVEDSLVDS